MVQNVLVLVFRCVRVEALFPLCRNPLFTCCLVSLWYPSQKACDFRSLLQAFSFEHLCTAESGVSQGRDFDHWIDSCFCRTSSCTSTKTYTSYMVKSLRRVKERERGSTGAARYGRPSHTLTFQKILRNRKKCGMHSFCIVLSRLMSDEPRSVTEK